MIPVYQQTDRDCFPACLASILEIPLECFPVPSYAIIRGEEGDEAWDQLWRDYLKPQNLWICGVHGWLTPLPEGMPIITSVIGKHHYRESYVRHAVICADGVIIHDPSPTWCVECEFIEFSGHVVLLPIDPARPIAPELPRISR